MKQNEEKKSGTTEYSLPQKSASVSNAIRPISIALPIAVIVSILVVLAVSIYLQDKAVARNAEDAIYQMSEHVAGDVGEMIDYASSSIQLASVTIAQTMDSDTLENPAAVIKPMVENTPFGAIEYIRADGMNVMNIGEPFDASDRVYYIEGIQGHFGVWNNYHPKTSKEPLMNFYAPLIYQGKVAGVVTGYIGAITQIAPIMETRIYGKEIFGFLIDEDDKVICSTGGGKFVPDLTLEMLLDKRELTEEQKQEICSILKAETKGAVAFRGPNGIGRICVSTVPDTKWRIGIIVPATSFQAIVNEHTKNTVIAIVIISLILMLYATYVLLRNVKRRKEIAAENAKLEEDNRIFNEKNQQAFAEISEIRDIIASANMGTWRIELVENEEPRMYIDEKMKELLGISNQERTPEQTYTDWFSKVTPEAVPSVLKSVERMQQGNFDENTYLWVHPVKGVRYVRCGGTAEKIPGGYSLRGYHYDVDDVVRKEQEQMILLQNALNEKNEYYDTLGTMGDIFYSIHVLDLKEDTAIEFSSQNEVKEIVNHKQGAIEMMQQVMTAVNTPEYMEAALAFSDLTTLADRMQHKKMISKELIGTRTGWYLASFITMEADAEERPTKVIFTTRVIDEEKKQEETLIRKTQTDEMTGLLNRRAYEEGIYAHNDIPNEDNFIYISLDVNGLKVINDSLGHMAGDELIVGACQCMRKSLGEYGKLYRIGGDEFVAILFCETEKMAAITKDFDETIVNWKGELLDGLSISYGWISKAEKPDASVRQLGAIAEQRMYDNKSAYYRKKGMDRRGQQDAHKALCELYTKILKINVSDDSYQIVNMNTSEQTTEKGFSENSISEWLSSFGKSGHVHPDDLENYLEKTSLQYLREYFAGEKTSLSIFYRRKCEDGFKQVMMEIIPANDYSEDDQSLFLYVKDIDK